MIPLTKKLKKNKFKSKVYPVYTAIEADEEGIIYKHWKDCKESDWGVSDDNYVSECLQHSSYKKGIVLTFPFGRQWVHKTSTLEFEPHYMSGNLCNVSTKSYNELEAQSSRAELAVDAFLSYKMAGLQPDMNKIGTLYRPDQENPAIAAKRLFKTKEAKQMIEEKLKEVLVDREIDEGFVLDTIKDAIEVAKVKENSADMIRAAKELSIFLDMAPKQKQVTETLELDMSSQIEANYEKQQKKLVATKTQDINEENNKDINNK